jgi:hypothetical protein
MRIMPLTPSGFHYPPPRRPSRDRKKGKKKGKEKRNGEVIANGGYRIPNE